MSKRDSVLAKAALLDASILSGAVAPPGGGARKEISKPEVSPSSEEDTSASGGALEHLTATRAKPPSNRRPSKRHLQSISRGNSIVESPSSISEEHTDSSTKQAPSTLSTQPLENNTKPTTEVSPMNSFGMFHCLCLDNRTH